MKEERFFYVPDAAKVTALSQEEAGHAIRVLRLKEDDTIYLLDGEGGIYRAVVTLAAGKKCEYRITESLTQEGGGRKERLHIAIAPTKMMERMEWMAEKATEIGIGGITFLETQFSERRKMRTERIERIVIAAMKQSRRAWKPVVNDITPFKTFIDTPRSGKKYLCHCHGEIERKPLCNEDLHDTDVTILIGPEGDFSAEEVRYAMEHGYESISLGDYRLRTETAALVATVAAMHSS